MNQKSLQLYVILAAVFVASLVAANMLAVKVVMLWGQVFPAGVLAYSLTFAVTDTIGEIWGRRRTQTVVIAGFLSLLFVWVMTLLAVQLPSAPFFEGHASYTMIFGTANRIIIASLIAYAVSQTCDVYFFHWIRGKTDGKYLWLRNNVSTFLSQTIDTTLFITIAFYGNAPVLTLIGGQLLAKYAIALADTPLIYLLVRFVRGQTEGSENPAPTG